jgi:hypothetical protein
MALLTEKEVAEKLRFSVRTLQQARCYPERAAFSLPFVKIGKAVRYKSEDVDALLQHYIQEANENGTHRNEELS